MSNLGKRLVVYVTFIALVVTMCAVPQVLQQSLKHLGYRMLEACRKTTVLLTAL